jgi:hypothetical protein
VFLVMLVFLANKGLSPLSHSMEYTRNW